jgi:hypothetical protein
LLLTKWKSFTLVVVWAVKARTLGPSHLIGPVNLYQLAGARYQTITRENGPSTELWPNKKFHFRTSDPNRAPLSSIVGSKILQDFPEPERSQVINLASPQFRRFFPQNEEWILRNLTTREFARNRAIGVNANLWLANEPGFGEVVVSRIC